MNVAFLSLGGNIGNRMENLSAATQAIINAGNTLVSASSVYETEAWGITSKNNYLNQVIQIKTPLSAEALLKQVLAIEKTIGRTRSGHQYSDRIIDIDLLFFNDLVLDKKNIQVPHPRLHLRKFVLVPLNDIANTLVHPILKKKISALLKTSDDTLLVKKYKPLTYICVEGNIGSGKSTLAKQLAKKLQAHYLPEQFEQNHLLPLFYNEPRKYAFPMEYSFLISRFEQLMTCFEKNKGLVVADFSIYKCLWFAKINLPKKEYSLFKKHFNAFIEKLPKPGLIIHLKTPVDNLLQNIKKRGRPYEQHIKTSYLKSVDRVYKKGLHELKGPEQLSVNIKLYHPELENSSIKIIEKYLKENFG